MFSLSRLHTEQRVFLDAVPSISSLKRKGLAQDDKRGYEEDRLRRPREQVHSAQGGPGSCSVLLDEKTFRFDWRFRKMIVFWSLALICQEGRHRFDGLVAVDEKEWDDRSQRRGCHSSGIPTESSFDPRVLPCFLFSGNEVPTFPYLNLL